MFDEEFSQGDSYLHRIDPRIKILASIMYSFGTALLQNLPAACCALLFSLLLLIYSGLPFKKVFYRLLLINSFIIFLWLFLPFSTPGDTVFSILSLTVTKQGIVKCALITIKANAIFIGIITIVVTSSVPTLGKALYDLKVPPKLTFLILISYRYLQVIYDEYVKLARTIEIRGFVPSTNLHTYKTFGYLLAMVLIKSYDRAQRVYQAMLLRGFSGKFYSLHEFVLQKKDIRFLIYILLFTLVLAGIDVFGSDIDLS